MSLTILGGRSILVEVDMGSDSLILDERFAAEVGVDLDSDAVRRVEGVDETGNAYLRSFTRLEGTIHPTAAPALTMRDPDVCSSGSSTTGSSATPSSGTSLSPGTSLPRRSCSLPPVSGATNEPERPLRPDRRGLRRDAAGGPAHRTGHPDALGDARSVVNVGAGAGSYEPADRYVIAVEPSDVMAAQRPPTIPPALRASAADLPLRDNSVDAAMALVTIHHWDESSSAGSRSCAASPAIRS